MNANERFKELGFECSFKNGEFVEYRNPKTYDTVSFDLDDEHYTYTRSASDQIVTPQLHLAIHQKMRELGWISESINHTVSK